MLEAPKVTCSSTRGLNIYLFVTQGSSYSRGHCVVKKGWSHTCEERIGCMVKHEASHAFRALEKLPYFTEIRAYMYVLACAAWTNAGKKWV